MGLPKKRPFFQANVVIRDFSKLRLADRQPGSSFGMNIEFRN